ncbi:MAG: flagellar biosynthesis protein FlhB [candidate division Zixibacteria bacterium]|nr:flagellar biosynthesis protein FlhB [candidate division Zixibacteria bacterium]
MADEQSTQDKTEDPTPRRIGDARKKGQVAKSQELSSVAIITAGLSTLFVLAPTMMRQFTDVFVTCFTTLGQIPITTSSIHYFFQSSGMQYAKIVAPFLLIIAVVAFFATFLQVGPLFSFETLEPKFDKLDIVKGLKKVVSKKSLFDLFKDSGKIFLIGIVAYSTLKADLPNYIPLMDKSIGQILIYGSNLAFKLGIRCAMVLILLAVLDFAWQKHTYKNDLKMSKQEVKDEHKQYEGDPTIKAKIKRIQREQAQKRMLQDIKTADVVVTNPTQIAVALKYDRDKMTAPMVVAKGQRLIAAKIRELAEKFDIPIVEDKPLARSLFKYAEIGMEVPENLYKAVAEILAYVYKLKDRKRT